MNERRKTNYQEISARVERVRQIYSRIGEPLPAEIIIDLCRHLGKIPMEMPANKAKKTKQA